MNEFILVEIMVLKSELEEQIRNQTATIASDIEKIIGKGLVKMSPKKLCKAFNKPASVCNAHCIKSHLCDLYFYDRLLQKNIETAVLMINVNKNSYFV